MQDAAHQNFLSKHFGLSAFRRGQQEIILSVLQGRDALAVLPTGGGKSLCYQYPAVYQNKLVIVISPLIALMNDQVYSLKQMGIPAGCIHSGMSVEEKKEVFRNIQKGGAFILYLSPERTQKEGFLQWIQKIPVALFAIDEAHCVSQWGHDFRAEYGQLKVLKELRPQVPVLALTASATPVVLKDIAKQLQLKSPAKHVHGFYRPNLYYQVEFCSDDTEKTSFVEQSIEQTPTGRILIYCGTRKITEEVAEHLSTVFPAVGHYHAGMSAKERTAAQQDFAEGKTRILVATNAFGMGIDHPDVRLVVHYQMPANIDSLYQEMGRAGRDGLPSTCLLLYAKKDKGLQSFFIQSSNAPAVIQSSRWRTLENLVDYAEGGECRHAEILTYYQDAQRLERCGHCDTCEPESDRKIQRREIPEIEKPDLFYPAKVEKTLGVPKSRAAKKSKKALPETLVLDTRQTQIFEILKDWRRQKAKELDVPAFVVFSDKTLRHMAKLHPANLEELGKVYGLGEAKLERFGSELLQGPLS